MNCSMLSQKVFAWCVISRLSSRKAQARLIVAILSNQIRRGLSCANGRAPFAATCALLKPCTCNGHLAVSRRHSRPNTMSDMLHFVSEYGRTTFFVAPGQAIYSTYYTTQLGRLVALQLSCSRSRALAVSYCMAAGQDMGRAAVTVSFA